MKKPLLLSLLTVITLACNSEIREFEPDLSDRNLHPLEAYLANRDTSLVYEEIKVLENDSYTAYVIRMESGKWQPTGDRWWHYLTVVIPEAADQSTSLIYIGGGSTSSDIPETANEIAVGAAERTGSVTAYLHNVPFQPAQFLDDPSGSLRSEDDLIAYGWRRFMEEGAGDEDTEWLSRLPMTRAVVQAMDIVTEFTRLKSGPEIENFVVSGASKRGWTAWTTAIFDDRVIAVAPAVIDLLNITPSFLHHWRALGEWSPAIADYSRENIMEWLGTPEFDRLMELTDPYSYLDEFDKPVYLINAASDEFFLPDSWQFYWDELPRTKAIRYIPNSGHSISNSDAFQSLTSFYQHILTDTELPEFVWTVSDSGFTLQYDPARIPDEIYLWNAHNPDSRDFRLYVIDRIWLASRVDADPSGSLFIPIETPEAGFTAWFAEAIFHSESFEPFTVTTGVKILPDIYLHEEFKPNRNLINRTFSETNPVISE